MAKGDETRQRRELTEEQELAIGLALTGKTDAEIGELVGVSRSTVNKWRNRDTTFIAALNAGRAEVWRSNLDRARNLVRRALEVVEADINSDDPRIRQSSALAILRMARLEGEHGLQPFGPETPEGIEEKRRRKEAWDRKCDGFFNSGIDGQVKVTQKTTTAI